MKRMVAQISGTGNLPSGDQYVANLVHERIAPFLGCYIRGNLLTAFTATSTIFDSLLSNRKGNTQRPGLEIRI